MIELINISKRYRDKWVLKDVHIKVEDGRCVGILGVNGSGKTTLLSILAGVLKADMGSLMHEGTDLLRTPKLRRQLIGYVPQNSPLIEELSAYDNLRLWYTKEDLKVALKEGIISLLGIDEFIKKPVHKLSMGMKKRLSIACAVSKNPPVLLLDEPTAYLDIIAKESIYGYLKEHKKRGGSILLVSHDVADFKICDEYYILKSAVLQSYAYEGDVDRLVKSLV